MEKWHIERPTGRCAKTGEPISDGEAYYAVLYEDGESFRREEVSLTAWDGAPEDAFCHFKTRMPTKAPKKKLLVDDNILMSFFVRLEDETAEVRRQFRFVLALILMRKKLLKYQETRQSGDGEIWIMRVTGQDKTHKVLNPKLEDSQIETVSRELSAVLHGDVADSLIESESEPDETATAE